MLKPLPPSKIRWIYCYDCETGFPIREFSIYGNKIFFKESYREIMVDYTFTYEDKIKVIEVSTVLLELPKIKLSSNLSLRLGKNYDSSTVSDFYFTGYPSEETRREEQRVARITFLETELTGDYL